MSVTETLISKLMQLPPDRHEEILAFVESLQSESTPAAPRQSPYGLWAEFDLDIGDEDIRAARREMWSCIPREDIA